MPYKTRSWYLQQVATNCSQHQHGDDHSVEAKENSLEGHNRFTWASHFTPPNTAWSRDASDKCVNREVRAKENPPKAIDIYSTLSFVFCNKSKYFWIRDNENIQGILKQMKVWLAVVAK